ncbi:MAG TPA: hypothetical protein VFG47_03335, partial [Geminicoccaceae bacterium]|nr:hypothetical protein [Geminicoccaceae bacterium]
DIGVSSTAARSRGTAGLRYFEGRSWRGLRHHAVLCQLAFAFLQHLRLGGQRSRPARRRTAAPAEPARRPRRRADLLRPVPSPGVPR